VILRGRQRSQVRDEQVDIFERGLLMLLEIEAEPAGGEAAEERSGRLGGPPDRRPS
jgi:hypothetical protein